MLNTNELLKLNASCFLIVGTILIIFPDASNLFFNKTGLMPKLLILSYGLGLNIFGLLLSYLAKGKNLQATLIILTIIINATAALIVLIILLFTPWITTTNALTTSGLWIILLNWLSWNIHKA